MGFLVSSLLSENVSNSGHKNTTKVKSHFLTCKTIVLDEFIVIEITHFNAQFPFIE